MGNLEKKTSNKIWDDGILDFVEKISRVTLDEL